MTIHNPKTVSQPTGYSQGIEVPAGARTLYIAGQLGLAADGAMAAGFEGQAAMAWQNILHILAAAGMGVENLVKVNHYLTRKEDLPTYRAVRARFLGSHAPASTLLVIAALAREDALVEVEAIAVKA